MLIHTGLLLTGDAGDRAQSLTSDSSTVESRLLSQAALFDRFGAAILKQSELQLFFLPPSFFSFSRTRFWFWWIDALSQEVSSQRFLKPSALKHRQSMWKCGVKTSHTAYALREPGGYEVRMGHPRAGFCRLFCVFGQVISGQRAKYRNDCLIPA